MTPKDVYDWWELIVHAPLSLLFAAVAVFLLYTTFKLLRYVVEEIKQSMAISSMLRDELTRTIKERDKYIEELEETILQLKSELGAEHVQDQ